ncbi:VacJ family lipoprotein [Aestuariivita sp.]|jgi:phospholipid-binding lipoprotein MlaA|uniref:MlaA family lipoprotein n=1 Tax=Aestuariivita sp. TaxID=1872407 RepID=UPI00216E59CF|nr:VacJ family lipoprotein [Aestuariivita sp.]MCE8007082.1 VacJ family lipoprotein [Aestuariivita sp.]
MYASRLFPCLAVVLVTGLAACTVPPEGVTRDDGVFDPYEQGNRKVHKFNRGLDRALVRPAARGYSTILPDEIETGIGNFAGNASMPGVMVNGLLQGDLETTGIALSRFFINTVFGFGGLLDVATAFEIPEVDTDFGETLYVWGAPEGAYIELPVLGPATERAAVGKFVDLFTNPLSYALDDPESYYGTAASVGARLSDRDKFSDTVDSILYESSDSYAQLRLIYLQNRRFELGQTDGGAEIDPFALETEGF